MAFGSLDCGEDGEYSGVGSLEVSGMFATQDALFWKSLFMQNIYGTGRCR